MVSNPFEFEIENDASQQQHEQECERHDDEEQAQASYTHKPCRLEQQAQQPDGEQNQNGHCDLQLV
jgi:hypothetical protein